jgi:PII-like signaling protein
VSEDGLKLTVYFGERDRADGRFLADTLSGIYARHGIHTSLIVRGIEGFGVRHHLHTDRLLSLSEDLPLVSVAVDTRPRMEALLGDVNQLRFDGLVTLERARLIGQDPASALFPSDPLESTKVTVFVGRHERAGGRPAYEAVVDVLHRRGMAGATVLLGIDGTAHGRRRRARFFAANSAVPLMVIGVGDETAVAEVLPELRALLTRPLLTLERVRVCKCDGRRLAAPHRLPQADPAGVAIWQKLMVHAPERAVAGGRPLHSQLVRELRRAGASGATTLRGVWGYTGHQTPHGDSFWQLRRRVPTLTVVVDTPERTRSWFEVIDGLTGHGGLVTSEVVPAYRATGPGIVRGGLRLAQPGLGAGRDDPRARGGGPSDA